jgi:hypothetical protein
MVRAQKGRGLLAAGSLRWALVLIAAMAALLGGVQMAVLAPGGPNVGPVWATELFPAAGFVYVTAGVVAWWRRPSNRLGTIMVVGGLSMFISGLESFSEAVLMAVGIVLQTVILALVLHLLLAFPSGQLRSRIALLTVIAVYINALVLQIPLYLFDPQASPGGMLAALNSPGLLLAGKWIQEGVGIILFAIAAVILSDRQRRASARQRRVLGPLYLYGLLSVLAVLLIPDLIAPLVGLSSALVGGLQVIVLMGIPVAFAPVLLVGGFVRTGEIQELGAWLSAVGPTRTSLERALAGVLGDDSLELGYYVAEQEAYVDAEGKALEVPAPSLGRRMSVSSSGSDA